MSEESKSIWKKPWMGWRALPVLILVLAGVGFVGALLLGIFDFTSGKIFGSHFLADWIIVTIGTTVIILALFGLFRFLRWVCCWKNFRRFLFGVACLITLIALAYAEEDWRGWHDWNKFKHEQEAKGEKFDIKQLAPPPVPDDQNFALTPIVSESWRNLLTRDGKMIPENQRDENFVSRLEMPVVANNADEPTKGAGGWQRAMLADLKPWQDYYRQLATKTNLFPVPPQPQSPAQDVLFALSKYDSTVEELREASKLPYSRFPLEYDKDNPAAILLPHLAALKQCSLALQLRAIAELQNGENEKAFDDVKLIFRLTDSIRTEPFIISQLVRFAMVQIAMQPIWEGLAEHKWSDAQLAELDAELAKLDFPADYEFSVRGESAFDARIIDWIEQKRGRYWLLADMTDNNNQPNTIQNFLGVVAFYLAPKGWFYQNEIAITQVEQRWNLPLVDATNQTISPKMAQASGKNLESSLRRPTIFNFFARLLLPGLGNYAKKTAYGQNWVNLARVAIALERYRFANGGYPDSLEAVAAQFPNGIPHDIINGEPLHYRCTDDGQFVLYSVGWNETDDGGIVGLAGKGNNVDNTKGDWVWRYPQK